VPGVRKKASLQFISPVCRKNNGVFSSTTSADGKGAFSIDNSANSLKSQQLALITEVFCTFMESLCRVSRGKTGETDTGKRDYQSLMDRLYI
jgi:hypothetical protein